MSQRKWLKFGVAGLGLLALIILLVFQRRTGGFFTPTYSYNVVPSRHAGFMRHVLRWDKTTYESDYAEYGLSAAGNDQLVGQTSFGGKIYAIPGEDSSAYVVLYDLTSPVGVFRNLEQPAFDWRTTSFKEMRLFPIEPTTNTKSADQSSMDAQLIREAITALQANRSILPLQVTGKPSRYGLNLFSNQHPGMIYCLGVFVDGVGNVYLAENTLAQEWFPAGKLFSDWVKTFHK